RTTLDTEALSALREYMNPKDPAKKKGKMMVLFDVVVGPDNQMIRTGMESFLQQFNVEVGNDRILSPDPNNPQIVTATPDPNASDRNAVAVGLGDETWYMTNVRTVKPRTSGPPQGPSAGLQANMLLTTTSRPVWAETNLDDPVRIVESAIRDRFKGIR